MRNRNAVCIGNNYPRTSAELAGCVNDALDCAEFLHSWGYDVVLLQEATRATAMESIKDLVDSTHWGDKAVLHCAGHGTYVTDSSGDEPDGRDEALVMADFERGRSGLIVDDELQALYETCRGAVLNLADCCFSGTLTRVVNAPEPGARRFLSPARFTDMSTDEAIRLERLPSAPSRKTASLISGCQEDEYALDVVVDGRPNGAFTRALVDSYRRGMSLERWYRAIRMRLPSNEYAQTPQLSATPYRKYTKAL